MVQTLISADALSADGERPHVAGARRPFWRPRAGRRTHWALIGLLLLGLALRVQRLDFQPLWWDEGYSVWFAVHPLSEMIALTARDIHPPLYYALLQGWIALLGPAPITLRLFSVWASLPAIALIYVAGRRLLARPATAPALAAAALVAFNPFHLYYSQEIRMYGLVGTLALAYLISAAPWLRSTIASVRRPNHRVWQLAAVSLTTTALAYTQYYAILLPLGVVLLVVARRVVARDSARGRSTPGLALFMAAHLAAALLYTPWVIYAAPKLAAYVAYKVTKDADAPLALLDYVARHGRAFIIGHAAPAGLDILSILALLLLGALIAVRWWSVRRAPPAGRGLVTAARPRGRLSLAWVIVFALAAGFLLNLRFPFAPLRGERLLTALAPLFWLGLATIILRPNSPLLPRRADLIRASLNLGLVLVTLAALIAFFSTPRYAKDDYRPLIAEMSAIGSNQDFVFCVYPWQVGYLRSYLPDGPQPLLSPSEAWTNQISDSLHEILQNGWRIWFPAHLSLGGILEGRIEDSLMQQGFPVLNQWISPSTRLTFFVPPPRDWQAAAGARFGDWLTLESAQVGAQAVASGSGALPVSLRWRVSPSRPSAGSWQVRLRLTDNQGTTWAQRDSAPVNGQVTFEQWPLNQPQEDRHALWIPAGTPPGRYELRVQVYEQRADAAGRALDVLDNEGQAGGVEWRLGQIEITRPQTSLNPTRLTPQHTGAQRLGAELRWLGSDLADGPWTPGADLPVNLAWQVIQTPTRDWRAFVQLLAADGKVAAGWEGPPLPDLPSRQWQTGDLLRTPLTLRLPAGLADGRYRLIVGFFDPASGQRLAPVGQRDDFITVATVQIKGRPHQMAAPAPAVAQTAQFGSQARLLGYDVRQAPVSAGETVTLTLHWQAGEPWTRRASVFVHLLASDGRSVAQGDGEPGAGQIPTTSWLTGEYVADPHVLPIPATLPPGSYRVGIGFYFSDETRLPLIGRDGQIVGDQLVLATTLVVN